MSLKSRVILCLEVRESRSLYVYIYIYVVVSWMFFFFARGRVEYK